MANKKSGLYAVSVNGCWTVVNSWAQVQKLHQFFGQSDNHHTDHVHADMGYRFVQTATGVKQVAV